MTKVVVITGSTSGIGKELLNLFSNDDYMVFGGYRNSQKLSKTFPDNIIPFYINMTDRNSILEAADFIKSKVSHIDILINVAGCVIAGPLEITDVDRLKEQFDVNVFSHIEFTQKLLSLLDNSKIINISSMASYGLFPFISPYCASKRALDIFFNAFAIENHKNIKVISIKPGVIATPLWEKSVEGNASVINYCGDYQTEMEFLKNNALLNANRGLNVIDVAKFIKKVAQKKNPKTSYTIGIDAKMAEIFSHLPQDCLNKLVKFGIKVRCGK